MSVSNIRLVGDLVGSLEIISVPDAPHCIAAISSSDGSFARDGLFVVGVERECVCVRVVIPDGRMELPIQKFLI